MPALVPIVDAPAAPPAVAEFWAQVWAFLESIGSKAIGVLTIVAVALLVGLLLRVIIRRVVKRIVDSAKSKAKVDDTQALERSPLADMRLVQRTRTLGSILINIINVAVVAVAALSIVNVVAPDLLGTLGLLTAALGAGLGFGAQNIVKDVLNGMFIVAEDQIGIGDVVDLGLASGVVEFVSVRVTQVRDVNGTLWYVRNGEVQRIGNMSQGWARAIVDLGVDADADIDAVEDAALAVAQSIADDPRWRTRIVEAPELWGLEAVTGEALVVRVVIKTRANAKDDVAQELRSRLRDRLRELDVMHPTIASIVPTGMEGARRVRGANPPRTRPTPAPPVPERGTWRRKKTEPPKEQE